MLITVDTNAEITENDRQILEQILGNEATGAAPKPQARKAATTKAADPEPEEDLLGTDGPTLQDAVDLATKLVSEKKGAAVKAALAKTSAKKVSDLKGDDIATFLAELA